MVTLQVSLDIHCPVPVISDQDLNVTSDAEPVPGQVKASPASSPQLLVCQLCEGSTGALAERRGSSSSHHLES